MSFTKSAGWVVNTFPYATAGQAYITPCPEWLLRTVLLCCSARGTSRATPAPDPAIQNALSHMVRECRLNGVMIDAAIRGSIGSAAILLRILGGRLFFEVLDTTWLTPTWRTNAPDTLERVSERYRVRGGHWQTRATPSTIPRPITGFNGIGTPMGDMVSPRSGWSGRPE